MSKPCGPKDPVAAGKKGRANSPWGRYPHVFNPVNNKRMADWREEESPADDRGDWIHECRRDKALEVDGDE